MCMFGMSFYIISGIKKSDINFDYCVLEQFKAVESMEISRCHNRHKARAVSASRTNQDRKGDLLSVHCEFEI